LRIDCNKRRKKRKRRPKPLRNKQKKERGLGKRGWRTKKWVVQLPLHLQHLRQHRLLLLRHQHLEPYLHLLLRRNRLHHHPNPALLYHRHHGKHLLDRRSVPQPQCLLHRSHLHRQLPLQCPKLILRRRNYVLVKRQSGKHERRERGSCGNSKNKRRIYAGKRRERGSFENSKNKRRICVGRKNNIKLGCRL